MNRTNLILLHGALGAASQMQNLEDRLSDSFFVKTFNFSGHGGEPFLPDFGIEQFANELSEFIEKEGMEDVLIFGYSMGGYVALHHMVHNSSRVRGLITLGTKMAWSPEIAQSEIRHLKPKKIQEKVPQFAQALAERHAPNSWEQLLGRTAEMMIALGDGEALTDGELSGVNEPVLVARGALDHMVSKEESVWACNALGAAYKELDGIHHPFEKVPLESLDDLIRQGIAELEQSY
mgnify:CR=1 FL=1